jgi:hypothetical protein
MTDKPDFEKLLQVLASNKVEMVVIGGVAMSLRASDYVTLDLDICFKRTPENVERLCRALAPYCSTIRSAFLEMQDFMMNISRGEKFVTDYGDIDLLGEVSGLGDYSAVLSLSSPIDLGGTIVQTLTLNGLIKAKEAANRPKDQAHLITLRALKQMEDEENS